MIRKALATLAAVLLIGTAAADTYKCTVPTDQVLNVRVQPSKKAATDGRRLFRGDTVDGTLLTGGKWISYKDDGVTVYASSQYMELVLDLDCYVVGDGRLFGPLGRNHAHSILLAPCTARPDPVRKVVSGRVLGLDRPQGSLWAGRVDRSGWLSDGG